jgi:nicotinate-nucleotide adenylyltransferase
MAVRVGFYGGSFNPPHVAHALAVAYARLVGGFDRIVVVPVFQHAFDKPLADFAHRVRMCHLAMEFMPDVEVSEVEAELERPNRTLATLEHLTRRHPEWRLSMILGADQVAESDKWHGFARIREIVDLFVLGRVGVDVASAPAPVLPGVSSTEVRTLLARRDEPDARTALGALVPRRVLAYIDEHDLYR